MAYLGKRDRLDESQFGPPQKRGGFSNNPVSNQKFPSLPNYNPNNSNPPPITGNQGYNPASGGFPGNLGIPGFGLGGLGSQLGPMGNPLATNVPPGMPGIRPPFDREPPNFPFPNQTQTRLAPPSSSIPINIPPPLTQPPKIEERSGKVLLFTVLNPKYPINVEVMHTICTNGGASVSRIIIIKKDGVQAMVEFEKNEDAEKIKENLNGADIYSGCCTLKIDWAPVSKLQVTKNDQDSWDYTDQGNDSKFQPLLPDPKIHTSQNNNSNQNNNNGPHISNYNNNNNNNNNNNYPNNNDYRRQDNSLPPPHLPPPHPRDLDRYPPSHPPPSNPHSLPPPHPHDLPPYRNDDYDNSHSHPLPPPHYRRHGNPEDYYRGRGGRGGGGGSGIDRGMDRGGPIERPYRDDYNDYDKMRSHPPPHHHPHGLPSNRHSPNNYNYNNMPPYMEGMRGGMRGRGVGGMRGGGGGGRPAFPPTLMTGGMLPEDGFDPDETLGSSGPMLQQGSVVMVYGLDVDNMNCDRVFNLFCLYGNVVRVKFLRSKDSVAMVQMGDHVSCERAANALNGTFLFNKKLLIGCSKQLFIQDIPNPVDLPDGTPCFKDYMGSRNNRYSTPEAAAKNRTHSSSRILYFFNAPPNLSEDNILKVFKDAGMKLPKKIKVFPTKTEKSSTGLIEFDNKNDAVEALVICNHTSLRNPSGKNPYILKFCFSDVMIKNTPTFNNNNNNSSNNNNNNSNNNNNNNNNNNSNNDNNNKNNNDKENEEKKN